jgi:tetratricopeptide (TPR) repeat protein
MSGAGRSGCVDADTAASYAEHRLPDAEMLGVDRHIDGCDSCRELISTVAMVQWSEDSQSGPTDIAPAVGGILPRGTRVGPFEIDRPIDAGGMGLVYAAHDARLDRRVALKGVRDLRARPDQLLREARTMAQLSHPNVVPVYDVIDAHGQIFLAMELVVGRSVRQWLETGPHGWKAIVDIFLAAGAGLAAAHAAGIIHGDVKPANILVGDDGRTRITDFGLSSGGGDAAPESSGPRGTPAYMAPAQRHGEPCDELGDQYSFCASLHEALFGTVPGLAPTRQTRAPRALRRILSRGLALDPLARYPSLKVLLRRLRATRSSRRRWAVAAAAVATATAALAYGAGGHRVQAAMCEASAPRLTSPWNQEARAMVERRFASTRLSYAPETLRRIDANLTGWTASLEAARAEACEPGWFDSETPVDRFSARLSCLEDRAAEARALVNLLRDADQTVIMNAIAATEQLAPVARCSASAGRRAPRPDPAAANRLSEQFARSHALMAAGRFRDALPVTRELVAAADALGEPSLQGAALVSLGSDQVRLSEHDAAAETLMRALRRADAAHDDRVRAQAWVNIIQNEYMRGRHEQVVFMKEPALGATERIGDLWLQSEVMLHIGGSLSELGRTGEAGPLFQDALRMRRRLYGDRDHRVASALSALGNAHAMQGELDAAIAAHRQAVDTAEAALGAAHPTVGILRCNLGDDYLYALRSGPAIVELERAAAIAEAAHGPTHRELAIATTDLGLALIEAGQHQRAAATFDRADAIWRALNPRNPRRAEALMGRYLALEALGRPAAVADLETAVALAQGLPPFQRARIQLALGRASVGSKSAALIQAAVEGLASPPLPLVQRELARARLWQLRQGAAP